MRSARHHSNAIVGSLLLTATLGLEARADALVALRLGRAEPFAAPVVLVSGAQVTSFVLETSTDLMSWTVVYHAFGPPGEHPLFALDAGWQPAGQQFWRARPAESLAEQEQLWRDHAPFEYTFHFRHMVSFFEGGVRGTVHVRGGVVVGVTDAAEDRSGQPILQPDLAQFRSIEQLFGEIGKALEAGAQQVAVTYDPTGAHPALVVVDRTTLTIDDESIFQASELIPVHPQ
jgi:hypothetical protein